MDLRTLAVLAAAAALVSALLVPLVRRAAVRWGAVDVPDERRVLTRPTPRLGGLAIFVGFLVVLAAGAAAGWISLGARPPVVPAFLGGALLVVMVGVADDLRRLPPHVKLAGEIVAALVVVYAGGCRVVGVSIPGGGALSLGVWGAPATVLWIVFVTNALNLIDGLDGLAAGTAAIALVTLVVIARGPSSPPVAAFAAILLRACGR